MAKGIGGHYKHPHHAAWATVHVTKDAELADLLFGSGGRFERHIHGLAVAADPGSGSQTAVTFDAAEADAIAEDLAGLLRRAREAGHPAADKLAGVAAQLGVREAQPEPASAPPAPTLGGY
jgi:hypothetical protein